MLENMDQWKFELGRLPQPERAELAQFLLSSLEPEGEGVDEAWDAEIARRVEEIRSGKAVGKPADQLFAELGEHYP